MLILGGLNKLSGVLTKEQIQIHSEPIMSAIYLICSRVSTDFKRGLIVSFLLFVLCLSGCDAIQFIGNNRTENCDSVFDGKAYSDAKGTLSFESTGSNEGIYLITLACDTLRTYAITGPYLSSDNLPEDFRKDGMKVVFSGELVDVPPVVRLRANPLRITKISESE